MYGTRRANDGYRARIGVVLPSVNTVMEAWFPRAAPSGVSFHFSRMPISADATVEALERMAQHEIEAARVLSDCEPDVIMHACTGSLLARGREYDLELMR